MSPSRHPLLAWALLALLAATPALARDRVLLKDGRVIDGTLLESDEPGYIILQLPGADIPIPDELVEKTYVESMENYVPRNKKEEKLLRSGKVLFEGTWVSRTRREQELRKRAEADEEAIRQMRKEQNWKHRKVIETRHFDIQSNCTQDVLDEYSELLENYYDAFTDYWNIRLSAKDAGRRMKFFLYRNTEDFYDITGSRPGVLGFFNFVDGELHLFDMVEDRDYAIGVLLHEGNHLLTHLIDSEFFYPPWMNEGMAEYFGTAKITDRGDFELGDLQYQRIAVMRNDTLHGRELSLREVLLCSYDTRLGRPYTGQHYSYGWSFVHFLMETPEYSKAFKTFFKTLPNNFDLDTYTLTYPTTAFKCPTSESIIEDLEDRLGKSLEELEEEWLAFVDQRYGELSPEAYFYAAKIARAYPLEDDQHIVDCMDYLAKAIELGIENAEAYRTYAEMLRKGGVSEAAYSAVVAPPDPVRAYEMAKRAIELDPINPLNYTEAAGALILDGPIQDLDLALAMTQTAQALAPRDWNVKSLTEELISLIEPARERAAERARREAELAAMDYRVWMVQPFYFENEEPPEVIDELSTDDLRELIRSEVVGEDDWIFQKGRASDGEGGLLPGEDPWDNEWTQLKDIPVFAEDLAAAG